MLYVGDFMDVFQNKIKSEDLELCFLKYKQGFVTSVILHEGYISFKVSNAENKDVNIAMLMTYLNAIKPNVKIHMGSNSGDNEMYQFTVTATVTKTVKLQDLYDRVNGTFDLN